MLLSESYTSVKQIEITIKKRSYEKTACLDSYACLAKRDRVDSIAPCPHLRSKSGCAERNVLTEPVIYFIFISAYYTKLCRKVFRQALSAPTGIFLVRFFHNIYIHIFISAIIFYFIIFHIIFTHKKHKRLL